MAHLRRRWQVSEDDSPQAAITIDQEEGMSKVRVLVGTRKGAFILTSDGNA